MNSSGVQARSKLGRGLSALAGAAVALGMLTGCGDDESSGSAANAEQGQMEKNLRTVMSAESPTEVADKFCAQFGDLIKSIPAELAGNMSSARPRGELTKLEKVEITGETATAEATGTYNGDEHTGPVSFKKEGGQWKYCPDLGLPSGPGQ